MSNSLKLSVIVPIYNEERYIEACVASLLAQDFPQEEMELLLVDGASTDRTPELLEKLAQEYPSVIRVLQNPKRIQSAAMNLGAKAARGAYLIRVDAHADYPADYFSRCIALMEETGAQNVGCVCRTVGDFDEKVEVAGGVQHRLHRLAADTLRRGRLRLPHREKRLGGHGALRHIPQGLL